MTVKTRATSYIEKLRVSMETLMTARGRNSSRLTFIYVLSRDQDTQDLMTPINFNLAQVV